MHHLRVYVSTNHEQDVMHGQIFIIYYWRNWNSIILSKLLHLIMLVTLMWIRMYCTYAGPDRSLTLTGCSLLLYQHSNLLYCPTCGVCEFPGTQAGLTMNINGEIYEFGGKTKMTANQWDFDHVPYQFHHNLLSLCCSFCQCCITICI
jgi:hypothetical protein